MKRTALTTFIVVLLLIATAAVVWADKPVAFDSQGNETGWRSTCPGGTRIQDGVLTYSSGHYLYGTPLQVGYDPYGYNYQAHMFNGSYANAYLGGYGFAPYDGDDVEYLAENPDAVNTWVWPYRGITLMMKWSDVWLANTDCNGDGLLDRGYSCDPQGASNSACEGAWLTNHMRGTGDTADDWTYFTKIIAAPADATVVDGVWYSAEGAEIGADIWGGFAIIQEVESGVGATWISPDHPGFGGW